LPSRNIITYVEIINLSVHNTIYFIYIKNGILSGRYVSTFTEPLSGPQNKYSRLHRFFIRKHCGFSNIHKMYYKGTVEIVEYMC